MPRACSPSAPTFLRVYRNAAQEVFWDNWRSAAHTLARTMPIPGKIWPKFVEVGPSVIEFRTSSATFGLAEKSSRFGPKSAEIGPHLADTGGNRGSYGRNRYGRNSAQLWQSPLQIQPNSGQRWASSTGFGPMAFRNVARPLSAQMACSRWTHKCTARKHTNFDDLDTNQI